MAFHKGKYCKLIPCPKEVYADWENSLLFFLISCTVCISTERKGFWYFNKEASSHLPQQQNKTSSKAFTALMEDGETSEALGKYITTCMSFMAEQP